MRKLFSCNVGARRYCACVAAHKQARAIFRELGDLKALWVTLAALPRIARAALEARRMKKRRP